MPDRATLESAWRLAFDKQRINTFIRHTRGEHNGPLPDLEAAPPAMPRNIEAQIRNAFEKDDTQPWDKVIWDLVASANQQPKQQP